VRGAFVAKDDAGEWDERLRSTPGLRTNMTDRILIVDDDEDACALLEANLARLGYQADYTTSPLEAVRMVESVQYAAVLTDLEMAEMSGLTLCEKLLSSAPGTPIIVVTGHSSVETAISAMRAGAYDYITKPVDSKLLGLAIARAVQFARLNREVVTLRQAVVERDELAPALLGDSPSMRRIGELITRISHSEASVLINGETGTGKELIARAIHNRSARAAAPFVAINCAAVPASLLESELFGHARGAFTDAKTQRHGLFVEASGGTLFLDEIGEMPLDMQAKLLRALQERTVRPLGSNTEVPFDARIMAATHRDLDLEIQERRFRQDLFYRINVVHVELPPLRSRGSDVLKLATHFLNRYAKRAGRDGLMLTPAVAEKLLAYDWPGNVRELENCMERIVTFAAADQVSLDDLPGRVRTFSPHPLSVLPQASEVILSLDEVERRHILRVIKLLDDNKSRAAELLGVDRRTLYRKLERYAAESQASKGSSIQA
jgi:DNA-binding NtrC family response regulator